MLEEKSCERERQNSGYVESSIYEDMANTSMRLKGFSSYSYLGAPDLCTSSLDPDHLVLLLFTLFVSYTSNVIRSLSHCCYITKLKFSSIYLLHFLDLISGSLMTCPTIQICFTLLLKSRAFQIPLAVDLSYVIERKMLD